MTPKQKELLDFIVAYQAEKGGVSPSYDEIRVGIGIASRSGVARLVDGLQAQGLVRRLRTKARTLEVVRRPSPTSQLADYLAVRLGVNADDVRRALLEMPA